MSSSGDGDKAAQSGLVDMGDIGFYSSNTPDLLITFTIADLANYPGSFSEIVLNVTWAQLQSAAGGSLDTAFIDNAISAINAYNAANGTNVGIKLRDQQISHFSRNNHLTGACQRGQARSEVDAVSIDIALVGDHQADVRADAQPHLAIGSELGVCRERRFLHVEGRAHGRQHVRELQHHAVAQALDQAAFMTGEDLRCYMFDE